MTYEAPSLDGKSYERPCGCRGVAGLNALYVDHFHCAEHADEAKERAHAIGLFGSQMPSLSARILEA